MRPQNNRAMAVERATTVWHAMAFMNAFIRHLSIKLVCAMREENYVKITRKDTNRTTTHAHTHAHSYEGNRIPHARYSGDGLQVQHCISSLTNTHTQAHPHITHTYACGFRLGSLSSLACDALPLQLFCPFVVAPLRVASKILQSDVTHLLALHMQACVRMCLYACSIQLSLRVAVTQALRHHLPTHAHMYNVCITAP